MKIIIIGLLALSLVGCMTHTPLSTYHTSVRTTDNSMGYHVSTTYGGWPSNEEEAKKGAEVKIDKYSKGLCQGGSGYTKLGEQVSAYVNSNGWGSGKVKNLAWEIKCNPRT